ncbi:Uncharacterized protein TCAP_00111 [Tolypocladium capitatum]|uniref:Uncharacterized protein n=1 Tax=Tolypocladium capitatum TaxID=45235 RepID=A0A2K3QQZ8_9HYPO|nr:Uncharacterized protein TCAP_00111 [Tolypocladium capitatum]
MKLSAAIAFSLVPRAFAVISSRGDDDFVPSWEVEVRPGETVILNGTVQEVHAQLRRLNPDWDSQVAASLTKRAYSFTPLFPNAFPADAKPICGHFDGTEPDEWERVMDEAHDYLNQVQGQPRNDAGPGNCGRSSEPKTLSSFKEIADGVRMIWYQHACGTGCAVQLFHPDNWNIIVKGTHC